MILAHISDNGFETYFDDKTIYLRANIWGDESIWLNGAINSSNPGNRRLVPASKQEELSLVRLQMIQRLVYSDAEIDVLREMMPECSRDCLGIIGNYVNAWRLWPIHPVLPEIMPDHPFLKVNNMIFIGKDDGREIYDGVAYSGIEFRMEYDNNQWRFLNMITDAEYTASSVEASIPTCVENSCSHNFLIMKCAFH